MTKNFLFLYNINKLKENINVNTIIYINDNLDIKMISETIKKKIGLVNILFVPKKILNCDKVRTFIKKFCLYNKEDLFKERNICNNCTHITELKTVYMKMDNIIKVLKNNELYRLSDGFKGCKTIVENLVKDTKYKDTILQNYLLKNNKSKNYQALFNEIIDHKNKHNVEIPDDNSLVVHLRTGDCLRFFANNKVIQDKIINNINNICNKNKNITHVILVTALHYGVNQNSKLYAGNKIYRFNENSKNINFNALLSFYTRIKLPVLFKSSETTDEDIVYLSLAKNLITTQGGFSKLINELNNKFVNKNNTRDPIIDTRPTKTIPINKIQQNEIIKNNQVINPVNKPVINSVNKPVINPVNKPVINPVNKPVINPVNKPVINPVNKPVINPVKRQIVKPVNKINDSNDSNKLLNNSSNNLIKIIPNKTNNLEISLPRKISKDLIEKAKQQNNNIINMNNITKNNLAKYNFVKLYVQK